MIVRAHHSLRLLFTDFQRPTLSGPPAAPWRPVVMDGKFPRKAIPVVPDGEVAAPECLKDLVPGWMGEALVEGDVLVMPVEDFVPLDEHLKQYLDVISY